MLARTVLLNWWLPVGNPPVLKSIGILGNSGVEKDDERLQSEHLTGCEYILAVSPLSSVYNYLR